MHTQLPVNFQQLYSMLNLATHERGVDLAGLLTSRQLEFLSSQITSIISQGEKIGSLFSLHDSLKLQNLRFHAEPDEARLEEIIEFGLNHCTAKELVGIITNPAVLIGISETLIEQIVNSGQLPRPWVGVTQTPPLLPTNDLSPAISATHFVLSENSNKDECIWRIRLSRMAVMIDAVASESQETADSIEESGWLLRLELTYDSAGRSLLRLECRNPVRLDEDTEANVRLRINGTGRSIASQRDGDSVTFTLEQPEELQHGFLIEGAVSNENLKVLFSSAWLSTK